MTGTPTPARADAVERLAAAFVVLDIEGTTSAAEAIAGDLYRYARPRLGPWIAAHRDEPGIAAVIGQVRRDAGLAADAPVGAVAAVLHGWMADDVKATPL